MQTFTCPECGAESFYDPWFESAHCQACGYTPPPPGTTSVSELLASQVAKSRLLSRDQEIAALYREAKSFAPAFIMLIKDGDFLYAFGEDANKLAQVCGWEFVVDEIVEGLESPVARLPFDRRETQMTELERAGYKVGIAGEGLLDCPKCGGKNSTSDLFAPAVRCIHCGYIPPILESYVRGLIEQGVAAAKQGDYKQAQVFLKNALFCEPGGEQRVAIWSWLAEVTPNLHEKQDYLRKLLDQGPSGAIERGARRKLAQIEMLLKAEAVGAAPAGETLAMQADGVQRFECPQCGGAMSFAPREKALVCDYCHFSQPVSERIPGSNIVDEQSFLVAMAQLKGHGRPVSVRLFACPACGAAYILGETTLSMTCAHCTANYAVEETVAQELIPPTGLIPFTLDVPQARRALKDWLKAQADLQVEKVDPLVGLYFPLWTFDLAGTIGWRGQVQSGWIFSDYRSGDLKVSFDDVIVPACRSLPLDLAEQIEGFDQQALESYQPAYLANWPAEMYELSMSDATLVARSKALEEVRNLLAARHGRIKDLYLRTAGLEVQTYKLILVPLYLTRYHLAGDTYQVVISGQSGVVWGQSQASVAE